MFTFTLRARSYMYCRRFEYWKSPVYVISCMYILLICNMIRIVIECVLCCVMWGSLYRQGKSANLENTFRRYSIWVFSSIFVKLSVLTIKLLIIVSNIVSIDIAPWKRQTVYRTIETWVRAGAIVIHTRVCAVTGRRHRIFNWNKFVCTHVSVEALELTDDSRFIFWRWNFSNNSPPPAGMQLFGTVELKNCQFTFALLLVSIDAWAHTNTHLMLRLTFVALIFGISDTTDRFSADVCCWICPTAWCCNCVCVGITTLSVSESRRELFAVEVAVLGLSRPPAFAAFWSMVVCDDDFSDWFAAGSGDLDWTDAASWIGGSAWTEWEKKIIKSLSTINAHAHTYLIEIVIIATDENVTIIFEKSIDTRCHQFSRTRFNAGQMETGKTGPRHGRPIYSTRQSWI